METQTEYLVAEGMVNIRDAAKFLGISVAGLYVLMGRGEIPYVKIGRSRRVPRRSLVQFAAANLIGGDLRGTSA